MRIVCPSCSAAYDVPDSLLTAGRVVRCARCGENWTPPEAATAAVPEPIVEPAPEPALEPAPAVEAEPPRAVAPARQSAMDRLAANPVEAKPSQRLRLAWAGSVAVLLLALGAAYTWRGEIIEAWPPIARAYAAFGLHPQPTGRP